jgi:probable phosphoglycerate mutase
VTAVLVRHGETAWNREGRVQGWAPTSLTDRGREQARTLGAHLASAYDVDRAVASDLRRARETAVLLHETGVDPAPTYSQRWRERDFGIYQGLTEAGLFETHPEFRATGGTMATRARPPGGERLLDLRERVLMCWTALLADATPGETVLVVTHGGPIYVLLAHLKGMDLPASFVEHSHDNCALTEVRVDPDEIGDGDPPMGRIGRENERP